MTDRVGEFGPVDVAGLQRIRNLFLDAEPLVAETGYDSPVNPTTLQVRLDDGIGDADEARFDVQWSTRGNYSFHYVDGADVQWRFDRHPNPHSPAAHFHPPPDASTDRAEPSCIQVSELDLVTRAVLALWRDAHETGDRSRLNARTNPP